MQPDLQAATFRREHARRGYPLTGLTLKDVIVLGRREVLMNLMELPIVKIALLDSEDDTGHHIISLEMPSADGSIISLCKCQGPQKTPALPWFQTEANGQMMVSTGQVSFWGSDYFAKPTLNAEARSSFWTICLEGKCWLQAPGGTFLLPSCSSPKMWSMFKHPGTQQLYVHNCVDQTSHWIADLPPSSIPVAQVQALDRAIVPVAPEAGPEQLRFPPVAA